MSRGRPDGGGLPLDEVESQLGYRFEDREWLRRAVTHPSYAEESGVPGDNQRLEFLGDEVVGIVVSRALFVRHSDAQEGTLSKMRSRIVSSAVLAEVARAHGFGAFLRLGVGEERTKGREKSRLLADLVESLAGAIFRDGGFEPAAAFVTRLFEHRVDALAPSVIQHDHKSALQEFTQARWKERPRYELVGVEGPAHACAFRMRVWFRGEALAEGTGASKKQAQQIAAQSALEALTSGQAETREDSTDTDAPDKP